MNKILWFIGGFALGLTVVSLSRAAVPKRASPPISEIQAHKVNSPDFEQDYLKLNSMESRYAESWDQQQKIRKATQRVAHGTSRPAKGPVPQKKAQN